MGESRYEELNDFSPRLKMAHFDSRYVGVRLPPAGQRYGLRVRSFANRELAYPTLLFLDEARRPTRLVSVAISTLHPDRKSTRLNSSHVNISYAVYSLKKKKKLKD